MLQLYERANAKEQSNHSNYHDIFLNYVLNRKLTINFILESIF